MTDEIKPKHPGGRPTLYNLELAKEICDAIACSSKGLRVLCKENPQWPTRKTILAWLQKNTEFCDLYRKSKVFQVEAIVDDILDIADDSSLDDIVRVDPKTGEETVICNSEWVNRSRLRVETRKWIAAKLCPRVYGDRGNNEANPEEQKSLMQKLIDKL